MIPELLFWGVLAFLFFAALHYWGNNVEPRKDYDADYRALMESRCHATGYNRATESALPQIIGGDFEYNAHALDWSHDEPKPAA